MLEQRESNSGLLKKIGLFLASAPPFLGLTSGKINAVLMVAGLFLIIYIERAAVKVQRDILFWAIAFAGLCLASLAWAEYTTTIVSTTVAYIQVVILLVVISVGCQTDEDIDFTVLCLLFSSYVNILKVVAQNGISTLLSIGRIGGGNTLSIRYTMLCIVLLARRSRFKNRLLVYLGMLPLIFFSFLQGSRKGIIILLLGVILVMLSEALKAHSFSRFLKALIIIVVVVGAVYYIIMNYEPLYNSIGVRVEKTFAFLNGEKTDGSTAARDLFRQEAIRVWKSSPFIGVGQDNFRFVNRYQETYAHDNFVEILANLGVVGFAVYYSYIAKKTFEAYRLLLKKNDFNAIMAFAIFVIFIIAGYTCVLYSTEAMYIYLGLAVAGINVTLRRTSTLEAALLQGGMKRRKI